MGSYATVALADQDKQALLFKFVGGLVRPSSSTGCIVTCIAQMGDSNVHYYNK